MSILSAVRTMLWMVRYAVVDTSPYASASKMTAASPRHSPDLCGRHTRICLLVVLNRCANERSVH